MLTNKSKLWKNIFAIGLMALLLLCSIFSITFALFSAQKEKSITINTAKFQIETTTETLNTSDLVANNIFNKTMTYNIVTNYDIYFRVYAIIKTQSYDNTKTNIIDRTDFVDLTNVSNTVKGKDNKWYYATDTTPLSTGSNTYSLTFTFKVSPYVSEDIYTDSNWEINRDLKTTITYYFEYCQVSGFNDWSDFE